MELWIRLVLGPYFAYIRLRASKLIKMSSLDFIFAISRSDAQNSSKRAPERPFQLYQAQVLKIARNEVLEMQIA